GDEEPPEHEPAPAASTSPTQFLSWGRECLLLFLLVSAGLLARMYALTELPQAFDLELIAFQIQSRTAHGFIQYIGDGSLLSNGCGAVTQLSQLALFHLFGTSVYTLRLTAVLWGTAAIPLLYWLVRRIAGSAAAIVSTVLFLAAPDQLFWSRTENTHFSAMAA